MFNHYQEKWKEGELQQVSWCLLRAYTPRRWKGEGPVSEFILGEFCPISLPPCCFLVSYCPLLSHAAVCSWGKALTFEGGGMESGMLEEVLANKLPAELQKGAAWRPEAEGLCLAPWTARPPSASLGFRLSHGP